MTDEMAPPPHTIAPAMPDDMPFIGDAVQRLRLDGERLEPEQFIVVRRRDSDGSMVAFGRIKPYRQTHELGSVAVLEEERGRGWGRLVVRELIHRFPPGEGFITTDLTEDFAGVGVLRT